MKKIEKRTFVCLALTLVLLLGLGLFVLRFFLKGGDWASFAANRHLYNSNGSLAVGRVLDRDGDVLSWVDESGNRQYYENATVRKATLHAVGDLSGSIGTSALVALPISCRATISSPARITPSAKATISISPWTPASTTSPTRL